MFGNFKRQIDMKKINQNKNNLLNKFYFNGKIKGSKLNKWYPYYQYVLWPSIKLSRSRSYQSLMFNVVAEKSMFKGVNIIEINDIQTPEYLHVEYSCQVCGENQDICSICRVDV